MDSITNYKKDLKSIEERYTHHDFPPNVLVEVTAHCNIDCTQCANSSLTRPKGYMDINLYKKIVDEVAEENPDVNFWLAFYGEPLLLKYKLYYLIDYAKKKGLSNTFINTNAMLLNDEMADMLIDSGIDNIILGVDGFSAEVFEKIRLKSNRNTVYDNILNLKKKLNDRKLSKPHLEVQFIVSEENIHELEVYKKFWTKQKITIKIRNRVTWSGHVNSESNISSSVERIACGWAIGTFPIAWDGRTVACGTDCNALCTFGNLNELSIKEIWTGTKSKFIDDHFEHRFDELPEICHSCQDWQVIGNIMIDENGNEYDLNNK